MADFEHCLIAERARDGLAVTRVKGQYTW
ncbi:hypothetical protein [Desulfovibrio sp. DV]